MQKKRKQGVGRDERKGGRRVKKRSLGSYKRVRET